MSHATVEEVQRASEEVSAALKRAHVWCRLAAGGQLPAGAQAARSSDPDGAWTFLIIWGEDAGAAYADGTATNVERALIVHMTAAQARQAVALAQKALAESTKEEK